MNFFLLALKNLRRHPGYTLLKATGLGLATAVIGLWGMLTGGFAEELQRTATKVELGLVQAHPLGWLEAPDLYDVLRFEPDLIERFDNEAVYAAPRLYGFALAGAGDQSVGVKVRGIYPAAEKNLTSIHTHLASGSWIAGGKEKKVIIGAELARALGAGVGGELILVGQGADGSLANDLYRVQGIMKSVNQEFDRRTVILSAEAFREFFVLEHGVHELSFAGKPEGNFASDAGKLKTKVESLLHKSGDINVLPVVRTWRELKPDLAQTLDMLKVTSVFSLGFTYIALGCLVVNSIMMLVFDRMREYGVMKAVGTEPGAIVLLILSEAFWLGAIAAGLSIVLAGPLAFYWNQTGLDLSFYVDRVSFGGFIIEPRIFAKVGMRQIGLPLLFLMITVPLAALYPALRAARIEPIDAINSQG